jgi:hypothetical protein
MSKVTFEADTSWDGVEIPPQFHHKASQLFVEKTTAVLG